MSKSSVTGTHIIIRVQFEKETVSSDRCCPQEDKCLSQ